MSQVGGDLADAARSSVKRAIDIAETRSKADVAASGLGSRWVASIKSRFYPNKGLDAAGIVYSTIPYSVVFERGANIRGNPTLWIPLPTTPKTIGGKRTTAKLYTQQVGRLFRMKIRGKDYLVARIAGGAGGRGQSHSLSTLRRKRRRGQGSSIVPLFVAVSSTSIRKRLHIGAVTEAAADRLPELFAAAMKDD